MASLMVILSESFEVLVIPSKSYFVETDGLAILLPSSSNENAFSGSFDPREDEVFEFIFII